MDKRAEKILENVKTCLLENFFNESSFEHNLSRGFFPLLEESFKYDIKQLDLDFREEVFYINKIVELFGEFSEDVPTNNPDKSYYDDFYFN